MKFLSCLFLLTVLSKAVFAQVEFSATPERQLESIRANLDSLERELDPMHMALVEPLDALADQLISIGQYDRAHRALDRAIQIVRINEGLYTPNQLPYQRKKILNTSNSGDWDNTRKQLEHLFWLYTKKTEFATPQLMDDLAFMADTHLRGIIEDGVEQQAYHLRRGSTANWMALAIGEALWGKDNPALVPIIYKTVNHLYLEKVATDRADPTSRILREVEPDSGRLRSQEYMDFAYHQLGYRLLNQIKAIYSVEESVDEEALAMAELYIADWDSLFKKNERALSTYKAAYDRLAEAVDDAALVTAFFEKPRLLPVPVFFPSLEMAQLQTAAAISPAALREADIEDSVVFSEWSANFPLVPRPVTLPVGRKGQAGFAIFSFNILGAPDLSKLLRYRNPAPIGAAENLSLLGVSETTEEAASMLMSKARYLRFRPKLIDGVPQQADAKLVYVPAA
ncbi:MAG: hypothetical protein AB8B95_11870 [Pseudohongiellaceae bacterium]